MSKPKVIKDDTAQYNTLLADLSQPVVLERAGQPVAVLLSVEEYKQYQILLAEKQHLTAEQARRAADRVVFGDLVGCALSSGEPVWSPEPKAHWRVPYRFFDGTLLAMIEVDAVTAVVSLTKKERTALLKKVESLAVQTTTPLSP
jgi:PHD/YefM family antitoxin component YafN of YafNO toxin-antitoxin module